MHQLFTDRTQLLQYLQTAAANPAVHWENHGSRCLDYRQLNPHIGVSCYIHCQQHLLILERSHLVSAPGTWGTVSGYVDKLELIERSPQIFHDHLLEEFAEELGWTIAPPLQLIHRSAQSLIFPDIQVHLELFSLEVPSREIPIQLNAEHLDYRWVPFEQLPAWEPKLISHFLQGLTSCEIG
jgi:8-oxo-dGTP pyrophosphatase MutT (NUDIX family)